jgi:hypothetical protein
MEFKHHLTSTEEVQELLYALQELKFQRGKIDNEYNFLFLKFSSVIGYLQSSQNQSLPIITSLCPTLF